MGNRKKSLRDGAGLTKQQRRNRRLKKRSDMLNKIGGPGARSAAGLGAAAQLLGLRGAAASAGPAAASVADVPELVLLARHAPSLNGESIRPLGEGASRTIFVACSDPGNAARLGAPMQLGRTHCPVSGCELPSAPFACVACRAISYGTPEALASDAAAHAPVCALLRRAREDGDCARVSAHRVDKEVGKPLGCEESVVEVAGSASASWMVFLSLPCFSAAPGSAVFRCASEKLSVALTVNSFLIRSGFSASGRGNTARAMDDDDDDDDNSDDNDDDDSINGGGDGQPPRRLRVLFLGVNRELARDTRVWRLLGVLWNAVANKRGGRARAGAGIDVHLVGPKVPSELVAEPEPTRAGAHCTVAYSRGVPADGAGYDTAVFLADTEPASILADGSFCPADAGLAEAGIGPAETAQAAAVLPRAAPVLVAGPTTSNVEIALRSIPGARQGWAPEPNSVAALRVRQGKRNGGIAYRKWGSVAGITLDGAHAS